MSTVNLTIRSRSVGRLLACVALCGLVAMTAVLPAQFARAGEREFDERFLEGLRQRRLFELAASHCRLKWETPKLSAVERGFLAVQWIQTLAEHARHSLVEQRQALVQQAHDVAADFGRRHPEASIRLLVRSQEALADVIAGELTRMEAEVESSAQSVEAARKTSRDAARALEQLDQELTQLLPQVFRRPPGADDLSASQLAALQHQLRLSGARALRNLGQCYPVDSDDRLAALQRAITLLDKSLDQLPPDAPVVGPMRVEQATVYRLSGKFDLARQSIAALTADSATAALQLAVRAEAVRILLAAGRVDEAAQLATKQREFEGMTSADLDFARLEALVARWQKAAQAKAETTVLQKEVEAVLRDIESYHGAYWKHRGELLLVRASLGGGTGAANLDLLGRTADSLYVQGRIDDALAAYDQAAAKAATDGQAGAAFSLRHKAALVQQRRQRHDDAAQRMRDLALSAKAHSQAAETHLLASWNLAQHLRAAPEDARANVAARYVDWLREHVATWPEAPSVAQARLWLGTWLANQSHWGEATAALRDIKQDSPHFDAALVTLARTAREDLAERRQRVAAADPATVKSAAAELTSSVDDYASWFESVADAHAAAAGDKWTVRRWRATLASAAIQLDATGDSTDESRAARAARAATLVQRAIDGVNGANVATVVEVHDAQRLLIRALAAQPGREAEAVDQIKSLAKMLASSEPSSGGGVSGNAPAANRAQSDAMEWFKLAEQLSASMNTRSNAGVDSERAARNATRRQSVATVTLAALEQFDSGVLGSPERARTAALRAVALSASGQRTAALDAYRSLAAAQPKDGAIQEQLATLLAAGDARADWEAALVQWRKIALRSEPRSDRWFRAKLAVATMQAQLGQTGEAAQLIRFLQATPPGLNDTPLKPQFEALLKRCESKPNAATAKLFGAGRCGSRMCSTPQVTFRRLPTGSHWAVAGLGVSQNGR